MGQIGFEPEEPENENMSSMLQVAESRPQARILDIAFDRVSKADLLDRVKGFIEENRPHQIVTANLQFMSLARKSPAFTRVLNRADLVTADGMPLYWMSRLLGAPIPDRITGHELLQVCASLAAEKGYSIFLLGGPPGVAAEAAELLAKQHPGLRIMGTHHGKFLDGGDAENQEELLSLIREFRPQFLFLALGCPKQDFWIHNHMQAAGVPVCAGIGGTLDVLTGRLSRAPSWMQRYGLEWLYRLQQEPRRLWRRYILEGFPTALAVAGSILRRRFFHGRRQL